MHLFFYCKSLKEEMFMKQFVSTMQYLFAGVGGFVGWFLGGFDGFLYALLVFVVIDYITGLMAAFFQKKLSSETGFKGRHRPHYRCAGNR